MSEVKELGPSIKREDILHFEGALSRIPGAEVLGTGDESKTCPVKHHFAPGVYSREMLIPKGKIIVSKIHRHEHHSFLMKGEITVVSEYGGIQRLKAPMVILSKPGAKRIGFAHEDTIWVTVHPTKETDLKKIEEEVIAKSYEELELPADQVAALKSDDQNVSKLIEVIKESEA